MILMGRFLKDKDACQIEQLVPNSVRESRNLNRFIFKTFSTPPNRVRSKPLELTTLGRVLFPLLFLFIFSSCLKDEASEKVLHSLDSLSGALNLKLKELQQVDTVTVNKALLTFTNYRQFISQNVNDTVRKEEGDQLQRFYSAGKKLETFTENRRALIARGNLINSQLTKLTTDLKNNSADEEKILIYLNRERAGADEIVKSTLGQQQAFQAGLEEFKISLSGVEELIKIRNGGTLPTIINSKSNL
jgi:hypothetical protein